jgi:hypothetical protein
MRNSQYLVSYLKANQSRGDGRGLAISSFLAYTLRGAAKSYSGKYRQALENTLKREVAAGRVRLGASRLGRDAYYFIESVEA